MIGRLLMILLMGLLTACGGLSEPKISTIQQAIAMEVSYTQQSLTRLLQLTATTPPKFSISHVQVQQQDPLEIQNLTGFHIQGHYDLTLQLPQRPIYQQQNTFDIYLQRQQEGKSWRLAHPQGDGTWKTELISG
ncbi:hypothetical protein DO97_05310 [Neosynechococcus sphagnicola sy1]|uniref:DUF4878 domain-containing protein n=1 Tax=Neosynechococcus sphagnicola sy1 TaxID=1497020 RepID=A0A098TPJ5_9CYAN|nr:hypothetical protein [Neosynechococcus sphagnicola]KGF72753.1 hypothetical protein DO97_05310 [Neosynechococcus sphagnicola sy1]